MVDTGSLTFRHANENDGAGLAELLRQLGARIVDTEEARRRLECRLETVFVAADAGGSLWGFVAIKKELYFGHTRTLAHVTAIAVHQAARNSGIGRGLMECAATFAREQRCVGVELTCGINPEREAAHQFYQSLGFVRTSYRYWLPFEEITH